MLLALFAPPLPYENSIAVYQQVVFTSVSVCLSVCLFVVCPLDYSKRHERLLMKFFGDVGHGPKNNRLNFGGDPNPEQGSWIRITSDQFFKTILCLLP